VFTEHLEHPEYSPLVTGRIMINGRQLSWCEQHFIRETHECANVANASQGLR